MRPDIDPDAEIKALRLAYTRGQTDRLNQIDLRYPLPTRFKTIETDRGVYYRRNTDTRKIQVSLDNETWTDSHINDIRPAELDTSAIEILILLDKANA